MLRPVLRALHAAGVLQQDPTVGIRWTGRQTPVGSPVSDAVIARMLAPLRARAVRGDLVAKRDLALIGVAMLVGENLAGCSELRWEDLKWDGEHWWLALGGQHRVVPRELGRLFLELRQALGGPCGHVSDQDPLFVSYGAGLAPDGDGAGWEPLSPLRVRAVVASHWRQGFRRAGALGVCPRLHVRSLVRDEATINALLGSAMPARVPMRRPASRPIAAAFQWPTVARPARRGEHDQQSKAA